jgi:hypothetical protein
VCVCVCVCVCERERESVRARACVEVDFFMLNHVAYAAKNRL